MYFFILPRKPISEGYTISSRGNAAYATLLFSMVHGQLAGGQLAGGQLAGGQLAGDFLEG